jgi:hypothetical protein
LTTSDCGIRDRYWFRFAYFGFEVEEEAGELLFSGEAAGLLSEEEESEPDFLSLEPVFFSPEPVLAASGEPSGFEEPLLRA